VASKSKRTLFEQENKRENILPNKDNPGPGKYEPNTPAAKNNSTGLLSQFASKVPNCKDKKLKSGALPGPGTYDTKAMKRGDPSTLGSKAGLSTDDSSTLTENANPFLSKTGRQDMWKADLTAPFTKQTFTKNPAPNHYFDKKRKDDVKARLLAEETVTVPFGSRDDRPCNKPVKAPNPGPGTYIDINAAANSSVASKLGKFEEEKNMIEA
jgi:hypothetical protein